MCAEAFFTAPTAVDRLQFLRICHQNIGNAPQATDWITGALDLCTQLPNAFDPSPIVDVQCARTFRAALLTISKREDLSWDHLRQASKAVQQVLRTGDDAPADQPSYDWFLDPAAGAHTGTPPRASVGESAVQAPLATLASPHDGAEGSSRYFHGASSLFAGGHGRLLAAGSTTRRQRTARQQRAQGTHCG